MKLTPTRKSVCIALAMMMLVPCGSVFAANPQTKEKNVVTAPELYAAMSARTVEATGSRESLQKLLDRPEVRGVAARAGMDLDRVRTAVTVLSGENLQVAANQAQRVNDALVGAGSIVITSTALIIGLLVLIILLVA